MSWDSRDEEQMTKKDWIEKEIREALAKGKVTYERLTKLEPQKIEFTPWPKISRFQRDICITEKIDGTNAAIGITEDGQIYAQSRNRIITPEKDNMGFARWVQQNADNLWYLGVGIHFGEWWGVGIGRGYELLERRFSLFNVKRWKTGPSIATSEGEFDGPATITKIQEAGVRLDVVPILYEGPWFIESQFFSPDVCLRELKTGGSVAAPGYMKPEGICIFHKSSQTIFKVTLEKDEEYKNKNTINSI